MPSPFTNSPVVATVATGNSLVDALLLGKQWAGTQVSYSFVTPTSVFAANYITSLTTGVQALSVVQQAAVVSLVSSISNYVNLTLTPSQDSPSSVGDVRFGFSTSYAAWNGDSVRGYNMDSTPQAGDIWFNPSGNDVVNGHASPLSTSDFTLGSYACRSTLWGLMLSLGLKNANSTGGLTASALADAYDGFNYTVMGSLVLAGDHDATGETFYPTTPMLLDIAALQAMYGANTGYNAGDTTYSFTDAQGQYYNQTLWDGGGSNTIAYTGSTASIIDLRAGHGSTIGNKVYAYTATNSFAYVVQNVWIAYGTKIDSAVVTGSATTTFQANDDGDTLTGGSGSDTFMGGAGNDVIRGNAGNDSINGGDGIDTAVYGGKLADYQIKLGANLAAGFTVTDSRIVPNNDGSDTLVNVERLKFADVGLALDLGTTQSGGKAVLAMGATLGPLFTLDKGWAAGFLKFFDSGASVLDGTTLLVNAGLIAAFAGGTDNTSFVKFIYHNVYGTDIDKATLATLVAPLDAHTTTQAQWMADMVLSQVNQQHVNLVGLATGGWQFQP
jgi:hypothetical protein